MSTDRAYHWRRHSESVMADSMYTVKYLRDHIVVASACGRLVDYQQTVGDPENADCYECAEVADLLNLDDTPNRDALIAYAQKHNLWTLWDEARGWVKCDKSTPGATEDLNTAAIKLSADPKGAP